jgi:hypothetical protein
MIVAVFCVAAAMIAGGAWAVFTGWELIIIERGWTQVLLGGMLITGGLLLGGIGVLATHVKRLAGKLDKLPGNGFSPMLVSDFGPQQRETVTLPPRPEPRATSVSDAAEEAAEKAAEKPRDTGLSAPAAVALGTAAGAGTAAIWSGLLSSNAQAQPEDEVAERARHEPRDGEGSAEKAAAEEAAVEEAAVEEAAAEEAAVEEGSAVGMAVEAGRFEDAAPPPASAEIAEAEQVAAYDGEIPTPDGEDAEMLWAAEGDLPGEPEDLEEEAGAGDIESEALEAEAAKVEGFRDYAAQAPLHAPQVEHDEAEHVIPPIEEPELPQPEPESAPEIEPEEPYSAPLDEAHERDAEARTAREDAAADYAARFPEEEADLTASELVGSGAELSPGPAEEPAEQPERSLVGTYESGGNIYTMYSDGSIDAQTPTGSYHFASLEELKNFIAQGGEDPLA